MTERHDLRLIKRDEWMWVCPVCSTARRVNERRCGHCGADTMSSASRRLGAAQRNLGDAVARTPLAQRLRAFLRH